MKITTNTQQLTNAVAIANGYISKEGDFAGKIVITGAKGFITVKSTDYIQLIALKKIPFVSQDLTMDSFKDFSIDGKKLLTALKAAKTDEVILEIDNSILVIKSGRSRVKIELNYEVQEISTSANGNFLNIDRNIITDFKKIYHAIDANNPKFELNGVFMEIKNGVLNLVSSDTRRLSVCSSKTSDNDMELIVPKEAISSMIKLFPHENIIAEFDDISLTVKTEMVTYLTKLINGKFPEYRRILPQSFAQNLTITRTKFLELIKEASLFEQQISILIEDGKITINDKDKNTEVQDNVLDESVNMYFHINAKSVLDFLSSYDGENVEIKFNSAKLPIVLRADSSYLEVCMPIVVENEKKQSEVEEKQAA